MSHTTIPPKTGDQLLEQTALRISALRKASGPLSAVTMGVGCNQDYRTPGRSPSTGVLQLHTSLLQLSLSHHLLTSLSHKFYSCFPLHVQQTPGTRPRVVVVTQGPSPTLLAAGGEIVELPIEPLNMDLLVDTNGAGESFVGGFCVGLLKGEGLAECVKRGQWLARVVVQQSGVAFPASCDYS